MRSRIFSPGETFGEPGMCSVPETSIRTGKSWEGTTLLRRGRGGKQKTGGSEDTHSIVLAFPGLPFWRLFSRKNRKGSVAVVAHSACVNRKDAHGAAWVYALL